MIRATAAAVIAAIKATDVNLVVYDADNVPLLPTYPYIVVWTSRRATSGIERRLTGGSSLNGWRVITMFVGRTAGEARWAEEKATTALDYVRLTVAGDLCTPCQFEPANGVSRVPDVDDLYSGTAEWTFVSNRQVAV